MFDGGLNFRKHISLACRSCYYHIRDLRRCVGVWHEKSLKPLQQRLFHVNWTIAMVSYNVTNRELNRLQGVQNCLARVVTHSPRFPRTTLLLISLHCFPVCFKIKFKICLVTYKASCNNQPIYLKEMLTPPKRTRDLRSSDQNVLFVPRNKTKKGEGGVLWRHQNCGIISPVKLELQKQFTLSGKFFLFHPSFSDLVLLCPGILGWWPGMK